MDRWSVAFLGVFIVSPDLSMVETRIYKKRKLRKHSDEDMMDFVLGSFSSLFIGFALMFGGSNAFIGTAGSFIRNRWQMQTACSTDCRSVYS